MNSEIAKKTLENNWGSCNGLSLYKFAEHLIRELKSRETEIEDLERIREITERIDYESRNDAKGD